MRHLRLLALVASALLLPIVACEDSSGSSSGGVFNPEAGPGFEAGPTPEAGPLPDGAVPDTATVPLGVTVTVFDGSTPKKDVRVIFHDASGLVTGQALTDIAGKVSVAVAPSMVTVLQKDPNQRPANVTFAGVAEGDNLKVVNGAGSTVPAGTYDVTFTGGGVLANANNFFVQAGNGCSAPGGGNPAATVSVPLFGYCLATKNGVLATGANADGILGFGFAKNIDAPVAAATVAVGPLAFIAPGKTSIKATNLPTAVGVSSSATLLAISSGQGFELSNFTGTLGGGDLDFASPTGFADAYQTGVRARQVAASYAESALVRREATTAPASATLTTFDFSTALPLITSVAATQVVPARPELTVTSANAAALATSDAAVVEISWFVTGIDSSGSWTAVLPPTTTSFKFPALPADATDFEPVTNSFTVEHTTFFDASQVPSYGAAKLLPVKPSLGSDFADGTRLLPAAGMLRVSRLLPNAG